MNGKIGNVGLLNLTNATTESIKGIERIGNVGVLIYRRESAHLIPQLNIGNIGKSVEIPDGYSFRNGNLNVDQAYLDSIQEPVHMLVNGKVIIDKNVQSDQINKGLMKLQVLGKVYSPAHLTGSINQLLSGSSAVHTYVFPPRFENGQLTLTNSFLQALDEPVYLVVNGLLTFSQDLDMDLFDVKIAELNVNGKISIHKEQELYLYKKLSSLSGSFIEAIPEGFEFIKKPLRINHRSIRRFENKKIYTKKPVILEADVSREALSNALVKIHAASVIICHENVEDLIFERSLLDTEILTYEHSFVIIEGEEIWSNDQFLALNHPANFIIMGKLTVEHDVEEDVLKDKILTLDILGEVVVREKKLKGSLQHRIRTNKGRIVEEGEKDPVSPLGNIGELSL